jgi:aryl-alcohol dehydrogenase-like predicted oxidoreductase/predicted GNAT family N-acyltransferase
VSDVRVRVVHDPVDVEQAYALRHTVFVEEQGVPVELEKDERDADADHVLVTLDGHAVGAGRLVVEEPGFEGLDPEHGPIGHLGRLAVLPDARGHGLGAALVRTIEDQARARGLAVVYLGAQTHAVAFYERLGYTAYGEEFDDAGLPHRHMWRNRSLTEPPAAASGTFDLGGDLRVTRLGFGAMRITGPGIWGPPADPATAIAVLRRAVELGVDFVDTADSYGPYVSEDLIREALHPYDGILVATKGGFTRQGPDRWEVVCRPPYLRQCVEMSLRRLAVDCIDLYQLHRIDPLVPLEDQVGELRDLQTEGKIRHLGLSEVTVEELEAARGIADIVSVQNRYNISDRDCEPLVDHAEAHGIAFIPWFPVGAKRLARPGGPLDTLAAETGHTPAQLAIAWLLRRSPAMLPIPGTSSIAHVEENIAAAGVTLDDDLYETLSTI